MYAKRKIQNLFYYFYFVLVKIFLFMLILIFKTTLILPLSVYSNPLYKQNFETFIYFNTKLRL